MSLVDTPTKRAALLVFTLSSFLTPFMAAAVEIALPAIGREFAADAVSLSWIATAFLLSAAMFLVPCGRLADIHGRKRVFAFGIAIYTLMAVCSGLVNSAAALIACRALQGIGSAMTFGTGVAILASVFPAADRGKVLGFNVAAVYAGLSGGPLLGGLLVEGVGWRAVFLANLPVGLLILGLLAARLKGEWADARGERFDLPGSLLYGGSLVCVMFGFSRLTGAAGAALLALGIGGLILFVRWELRVGSPVLDLTLFRGNPAFLFSNLAALINYSATHATAFLLSFYLQAARGFGAEQTGLILMWRPVVMVLTSLYAGRLSDRVEPRVVASAGMALVTAGLVLLIFVGPATGVGYLVLCLVVLGLGFGLFSSPNMNAVMGSVERRHYGVASGTVSTMRLLGQMFSMGIVTLVLSIHLGGALITPAVQGPFLASMRLAFVIFAIVCFAGIFASLARGRIR